MRTMSGNPHYDLAGDSIRASWAGSTEVHQHSAQIEATLALAFEQRTANLIAQLDLRIRAIGKGIELQGDVVDELNARLGLEGDDS